MENDLPSTSANGHRYVREGTCAGAIVESVRIILFSIHVLQMLCIVRYNAHDEQFDSSNYMLYWDKELIIVLLVEEGEFKLKDDTQDVLVVATTLSRALRSKLPMCLKYFPDLLAFEKMLQQLPPWHNTPDKQVQEAFCPADYTPADVASLPRYWAGWARYAAGHPVRVRTSGGGLLSQFKEKLKFGKSDNYLTQKERDKMAIRGYAPRQQESNVDVSKLIPSRFSPSKQRSESKTTEKQRHIVLPAARYFDRDVYLRCRLRNHTTAVYFFVWLASFLHFTSLFVVQG